MAALLFLLWSCHPHRASSGSLLVFPFLILFLFLVILLLPRSIPGWLCSPLGSLWQFSTYYILWIGLDKFEFSYLYHQI